MCDQDMIIRMHVLLIDLLAGPMRGRERGEKRNTRDNCWLDR